MIKPQAIDAITLPSTARIDPSLEAFKKIAEAVCAKYRGMVITFVKDLPLGEHIYQWQLKTRTNEKTGKYLPKINNIRAIIARVANDRGLQSLNVTVEIWENKIVMKFSDTAREVRDLPKKGPRKQKPTSADNVPPATSPATEPTE